MFSRLQKTEFFEEMYQTRDEFLEQATEWIASHLEMNDVFSDDQIAEFAGLRFQPDEVFNEDILTEWAVKNGYVLESSIEEEE